MIAELLKIAAAIVLIFFAARCAYRADYTGSMLLSLAAIALTFVRLP